MALLMVMGLALLIYALAERKVRCALQESGETIPNQVGKPVQRPTLRRIFQVFEGIDVLLITEGDELRERRLVNLRAIHRKILDLLGAEVKKMLSAQLKGAKCGVQLHRRLLRRFLLLEQLLERLWQGR